MDKKNSQNVPSEALDIFVGRLVEEKKIQNLVPEVMEQIKSDLLFRVEDRINAAILEHMPSEKLEEFNKLLDGADTEKINSFCKENIPNFENMLADELMKFRNIYLNS